ncbi:hypothetical protein V6N12_042512 [Hibiscus sabdariffa]|uniref:Uncharacterized protein n=1 Tax=Hibiscus sabdariffa TaxID=183260 RepID=A0ABR2EFE2_9ROSI
MPGETRSFKNRPLASILQLFAKKPTLPLAALRIPMTVRETSGEYHHAGTTVQVTDQIQRANQEIKIEVSGRKVKGEIGGA